ncbi:MAG: tRNA dihydrouridine synthase DusB, partial [Cyclonatronaceae bacterium]
PGPTLQEKLNICADQLRASVAHHGERYGVIMMKKHYGNYLKGVRNGKHLRMELMKHDDMESIIEALMNFDEQRVYPVAI